ncbi:MAG: DNA recombination protein RmuC [Geminicoccaceae bacterium]
MTFWAMVAGLLIGGLGGMLIGLIWGERRRQAILDMLERAENHRQSETDALLDGVKLAFADISSDTFRRAGDDVMRLAQVTLTGERRAHGERLAVERAELETRMATIMGQLERMQQLVRELEQDRSGKFGELTAQLRQAGKGAERLQQTTEKLSRALTNARARGQWGERMAEDLLTSLGMQEGVNFLRQQSLASGGRPDFTFLLPGGRTLHMDVKFPLDNLQRSLDADDKAARERGEAAFLRDVRQKIAEIVARGYVAPQDGTLDLALLLVPNEGVYRAMIELAPGLLDEALTRRVALVSPMSSFAVLVVMRHIAGQWQLSHHARELLQMVETFTRDWQAYGERADRAEQGLEQVLGEIRKLNGSRRRSLDRTLERMRALDEQDVVPEGGPSTCRGNTPNG